MCPRRARNKNLELITAQCSATRTTHTLYFSATTRMCYILRWTDPTGNPSERNGAQDARANNWRPGTQVRSPIRHAHGCASQECVRQGEEPSHIVVFTYSDHAGCRRTCESTSSAKLFYGSHVLRSTCTTQAEISLSSGEAPFYALVQAASAALGAVPMPKDLWVDVSENSTIWACSAEGPN